MAIARAISSSGPEQWQLKSDGHEPDTDIRDDAGEQAWSMS